MTIGGGLFLIAVGAILKYAVTANVSWINLNTVGVILIVIGVAGVLIGLYVMFTTRRGTGGPPSRWR
jgi:hypothetical protein